EVGDTLTATASGSTDVAGDTITYYYKFYDETAATLIQDWSTDNDILVQLPQKNHMLRMYARAQDEDGGVSGEYFEITFINNRAPVALCNHTPDIPPPNATVIFDAHASYDMDGTLVNYTWYLGDGNISYGVVVNHSYLMKGDYLVTLIVRDDDGAINSTETHVVVTEAPVANFTYEVDGTTVTFNASASYDPDGTIVNYTWNFGERDVGYGMIVSYTYGEEGAYTVCLTVTDNDGKSNSTCRMVDLEPPFTNYTLTPPLPNGKNGWYVSSVQIQLDAYDNASGVKTTYYKVNNQGWKTYTSPFSLSESGSYTIRYYSVDTMLNIEDTKTVEIKIDREDPSTECYISKNATNGWYRGPVYVGLTPSDNVSGFSTLYYRVDGGTYAEYTEDLIIHEGKHILEYFATDQAGNAETLHVVELWVDDTAPELTVSPYNGLYLFNRKIITMEGTIVIGGVIIEAECSDALSGIREVEFYIDGEYKGNATSPPFTYEWDEFSILSHEIKVVVRDNAGNEREFITDIFVVNLKIG
ncbi:MAG: hypothetical protein DRN37_04655, partial [Thermoplasmata archaeon]